MAAEAYQYKGHSEELDFSVGETVVILALASLMETVDITKQGLVFLGKGVKAFAKIEAGAVREGGVSMARSLLEAKTGDSSIHEEIVDTFEHPGQALDELVAAITLDDQPY